MKRRLNEDKLERIRDFLDIEKHHGSGGSPLSFKEIKDIFEDIKILIQEVGDYWKSIQFLKFEIDEEREVLQDEGGKLTEADFLDGIYILEEDISDEVDYIGILIKKGSNYNKILEVLETPRMFPLNLKYLDNGNNKI